MSSTDRSKRSTILPAFLSQWLLGLNRRFAIKSRPATRGDVVLGSLLAVSLLLISPTASAAYASNLDATVTQTHVLENGSVAVSFIVTKTYRGNVTSSGGSIPVDYTISGSAVAGTDFTETPVVAASGSMTAPNTLTVVVPIDNSVMDGDRTITLTLSVPSGGFGCYCFLRTASASTTIVDDETPQISLSATDTAASETGPDIGTYKLSSTKPLPGPVTVNLTATGTATLDTDYHLSVGTSTSTITQTSTADFNAGTVSTTAVSNGSVVLSTASLYYDPPSATSVGAEQSYGVGSSTTDAGLAPYVVALPGGGYRVYYGYSNGSYWQLAYRDTTDSNPPSSTNLGAAVLLGVGTASNDGAYAPFIAALPGGGYRLYYTYVNGSYHVIAYQDTTDTNLPNVTGGVSNLSGTQTVLLGNSASNRAAYGSVFQLPSGAYRLYYGHYNGSYWNTQYVETADTNPPSTANISAAVDVIGTSTTDQTLGGSVALLSSGHYRFYYPLNSGGGWVNLVYRDTTDTNPPDGTNLGAQVVLATSTYNFYPFQVFKLANGHYRLNYSVQTGGSYWGLYYRDDQGSPLYNTPGSFTSSVVDFSASYALANLNYTAATPTGTSLTMSARAGDVATPDGTWTAWQAVPVNGDISSLGSHRYVQYQADLATTDMTVTPSLDAVSVTYNAGSASIDSGLMQVTLPTGSSNTTITLTPVDDTADEYDETAILTVAAGTGYEPDVFSTTTGTVTIADNDLNEVNVSATSDGAESGGTPGTFTVSRTGIMDLPLTVNYTVGGTATVGSDYTALSGTVTIPASSGVGTNSATVSFTPINDALIEGTETISLTLSTDAAYTLGSSASATANIIDNDTDGSSRVDISGIFLQSDWATMVPSDAVSCTSYGGTWTGSACIPIHTDNRNGWSTFSSAGSGVDPLGTAGQVTETPTPQHWLQTDESATDRGFRASGFATTGFATVSGFGDPADVTLAPIDVGDGSDGSFDSSTYNGVSIPGITGTSPSITINTNEASHLGIYNFIDFKVAAGDTVTVTGNLPLKLYVKIDTKIDGTLSLNASGLTAGPGGGNGAWGPNTGVGVGLEGIGGGGPPDPGSLIAGAGGGGYATVGADGTTTSTDTVAPGVGGEANGDETISTLIGGSGGGGGNDSGYNNYKSNGGGGGGAVLIQTGASISVSGLISANGAAGSNYYHVSAFGSTPGHTKGPGGGGAGGAIKLVATNIVLASGGTRLSALGGSGGKQNTTQRGGDGADGRIRIEANNVSGIAYANAGTGTISTATLASNFISSGAGTYTSTVQYIGNVNGSVAAPGVWSTLSWSEDVPAGTTLAVWVHSCAMSDCSDRGPSDWSAVVNGQDISSLTFVDDAHAYIQYKVDMDTAGGALPRLHDLTISTISYGGGVWFQTDDSSGDTGFNKAGASTSNTIVVGSGDSTSVVLGGLAAGSGADGDFDSGSYDGSSIAGISGVSPNITINTDEASHGGVYNFANFTVSQGDTVRVKGSNPFVLKSLGNVKIDGTMDAGGYSGDAGGFNGVAGPGGGSGGTGCSAGSGLGAGAGIAAGETAGAGGAGHAAAGGAGDASYSVAGGAAGLVYGDAALPTTFEGGSGGGGAAVPSGTCANAAVGGGGGGAVEIISGDSVIVGTVGVISVDGGNGGNRPYSAIYAGGGAGGGSAGSLDIDADKIILNNPGASLSARGGLGGTSYFFGNGGNGGDGRINLTAVSIQGSASINIGGGSLVTQSPTPPASPVIGSYVSAIFDAGFPVSWDPVYWVDSVPTGTSVSMSVHSCAVADCSDRGVSNWSVMTNGQDISTLAFINDGDQYIQYRVDLTSDGRSVPRLDSIAINLKQDMCGSALVSSIYDSQDNANQIVALLWTADTSGPGTGVKFQLRTSADGVSWGPWYGPTSTTDYYTVSGSTINPVHADGVGDRYVQYKAVLINTNPEYTPILQDVTLKYITYGSGAVVGAGGAFGAGNAATTSSGGGGALGVMFLALLALGTAFRTRCTGLLVNSANQRPALIGMLLVALAGTTSSAYGAFVLNFYAANPDPSGSYKSFSVGNINSDFYQEFIIQKGFGYYQGDTATASVGAGSGGGGNPDILGFAGGDYLTSGDGTGNPSRVIIWQRNKSPDMLLDFLKDQFNTKPRIMQTVVTNDMLSEFSVDMRGISYSDNTTAAPMINTLTVAGQTTYPAMSNTWNMAVDSQSSQTTAGMFTYTPGGGRGGTLGPYSYVNGDYQVYGVDWWQYFDKLDKSNVWTHPANQPK